MLPRLQGAQASQHLKLLGLTGDVFVVVRKVLDSTPAGLVAAGLNLLLCFGLWFGVSFVQRSRRARPVGSRPAHA